MFGFQGGESADTVARKQGYMRDAQDRWGGLAVFDLAAIRNAEQLCALVKQRLGLPLVQVRTDVEAWTQGKQF